MIENGARAVTGHAPVPAPDTTQPVAAGDAKSARETSAETWRAWIPLLLGTLLAFAFLEYARTHILIKLTDAAFGAETKGFTGNPNFRTQCGDVGDESACVESWRKAGSPPMALWFGNSQLAGINHYRPGDQNAPEILRRVLAGRRLYLVSDAQYNVNLTEEAILFNALAPIYHPRLWLLPVCYDDLRETSLRESIDALRSQPQVAATLAGKPYWRRVGEGLKQPAQSSGAGKIDSGATIQARSEAFLTGKLSENWPLWQARINLRGTLGFAVHTLRNQVAGIHSTTKRPVDAGLYADRMALLDALVADARSQGIAVLLYAPPYRQDIDGPYIWPDYLKFKADLRAIAERHGARFADLDPIVPGPEWAVVKDDLFGFREPDFMHFTAAGHQRLAAALDRQLRAMGY